MNVRILQVRAQQADIGFLRQVVGQRRIFERRDQEGAKPPRRLRMDRAKSGFVHILRSIPVAGFFFPLYRQASGNRRGGSKTQSEHEQNNSRFEKVLIAQDRESEKSQSEET